MQRRGPRIAVPEIPKELLEFWCEYDWLGNVRELNGMIENVVLFSINGKVDRAHLRIGGKSSATPSRFFESFSHLPYEQAKEKVIRQFQQEYFRDLLAHCDGNYTRAAELAGVNRTTIYRILNRPPENDNPGSRS